MKGCDNVRGAEVRQSWPTSGKCVSIHHSDKQVETKQQSILGERRGSDSSRQAGIRGWQARKEQRTQKERTRKEGEKRGQEERRKE